jgi:hypothetical protein
VRTFHFTLLLLYSARMRYHSLLLGLELGLCLCLCAILTGLSVDYSCVHSSSWYLNTNGHSNTYFAGIVTDILTSNLSTADSSTWTVTTNRIPNYDHKFSAVEINTLNARPEAATDFFTGATTATAGQEVLFGADIGYNGQANGPGCALGYWPPGPGCPTAVESTLSFTLQPAPETNVSGESCYVQSAMKILYSECMSICVHL